MLKVNDRVIYDGQKATVIRVWRKTVRILTAGMEKMNVPITDLVLLAGQLELLDTARYEQQITGFAHWEIDVAGIEETKNAIGPTKKSGLQAIERGETDLKSPIDETPKLPHSHDPSYWLGKFVESRIWPVTRGTIVADYDQNYWLAENEYGKVTYRKGEVVLVEPESDRAPDESSITPPVIELLDESDRTPPESSITPPVIELLDESDRTPPESSITPPVIELESDRTPDESSITPPVIEPESDRPPESSITPPVIELESDRPPESSITPPVIELESDRPPESSITPPVIELESDGEDVVSGFNVYPKAKNGKTYHYWRYSYRDGKKTRHIHIGSGDRVKELQGKSREEISQSLGKTRKK